MQAIECARNAYWLIFRIGDFLNALAGGIDALIINVHRVAQCAKVAYHGLGGWLSWAIGQRGDGGVDGVHAQFRCVKVGQRGQSGQRVGVHLERDVTDGAADRRDEGLQTVRSKQAASVL